MAKVVRKPGPAAARFDTAIKALDSKVGKVGWFPSAKYDDGTPVAYVASIHEFGYPEGNIPARPFMRPTAEAKQREWGRLAKQGAKAILNGSQTAEGVLDLLGQKAAGDVAKTIAKIQSPPLAEATVDRRRAQYSDTKTTGSLTKPLVDTAVMIGSITNSVEDKT